MKPSVMQLKFAAIVAICSACPPESSAEGETVLADSPRRDVNADTGFVVSTARIGLVYPISTLPQFSFDCTQTNGWTVNAQNLVSRIPDLGGGARYLTSDTSEINNENYRHSAGYDFWYGGWRNINPPKLMPADDTIKGPYLDFGKPNSKSCFMFDPSFKVVTGDVTNYWNKLTNVGTVVGVFKPFSGSCPDFPDYDDQLVGGQLLGGQDFFRHSGYEVSTYGISSVEPMFASRSQAYKLGGVIWKDRQIHSAQVAFFSPGWEVVALNPADATTLETHGVGVGDCHNVDYSRTSGGQAIAELMIFDTVLSEEDVKALIAYLDKKWLPVSHSGEEGAGRVAAINLTDSLGSPGAGVAATVNVPAGETLAIDQVRGGRAAVDKARPAIVKTGSGSLTVNDASDFGGDVKLDAGALAFSGKPVPTLDQLPKGMNFRLDASCTNTMLLVDGKVAQWTNILWSIRKIAVLNNTPEKRPRFVANAAGEGLNLVDFGCRSEGNNAYLGFNSVPRSATVFAVVDARVQGGGHLTDIMTKKTTWGTRPVLFSGPFFNNDARRAKSSVWVNGRHNDVETEGYEVPSLQVVAFRLPPEESSPYFLGARTADDSGGLRLGELMIYPHSLSEEEIRDVSAYLMKKWMNRNAPGYGETGTGVADIQNVTAAAGTEIFVPAGTTKTIASLTAVGAVVKTGAGKLLLGSGSDISGGLVVREGSVGMAHGAPAEPDAPALEPILHLDATDANMYYAFQENGTNFVAAWQTGSGRSGAYTQEAYSHRIPFLNTWDTLNGHPVVDFGEQVDNWSNSAGRYFRVAPEIRNLRSAYVVYGSQAKGGQIFGSKTGNTTYELGRGSYSPTLDTPLFGSGGTALKQGEVYTNGVRVASEEAHTFKPTGGYQLIEIHTAAGVRFNALATSGTAGYLHGGCRMGEVIVYERPLTEREKVATRNYLLGKWFPETPRASLPAEPAAEPLAGNFSVEAGGVWDVAVAQDGTADAISVTGTASFGVGATLRLSGLGQLGDLEGLRVVVAKAGSLAGVDNLSVEGDVEFTGATLPRVYARSNGDLVVSFGTRGTMLIVH